MIKLTKFIGKTISSIGKMKIVGGARATIYILLMQLITLITLYIIGLVVSFINIKQLDFNATNNLIKTLVSADFIAAILILAKGLIDQNHNNIPDEMEKPEDTEKGGERYDHK